MSLDIYIVRPISFDEIDIAKNDYAIKLDQIVHNMNTDDEENFHAVAHINDKDRDKINSVVANSCIENEFKYIYNLNELLEEINADYVSTEFAKINEKGDVSLEVWFDNMRTWKWHEFKVDQISTNPSCNTRSFNNIACLELTDGSWDRSIFERTPPEEFYTKAEMPEFIKKYIRKDCACIFENLKDNELVWLNY